jgi:GT2 family glycosyltransferase
VGASVVSRVFSTSVVRRLASARRARRDDAVIRLSGLFDDAHYRAQLVPELATIDLIAHYLSVGARRGMSPHPLFQPDYYVEMSATAARSTADPFAEYLAVGCRRAVSPHPLFDHAAVISDDPAAPDHPYGPFGAYVTARSAPPPIGGALRALMDLPSQPMAYGQLAHAAWLAHHAIRDRTGDTGPATSFDHAGAAAFIAQRAAEVATFATPPLVSVIMPTKDRREQLLEAIASVRRQTYGRWELLVVDDGGTDGTEAAVAAVAQGDPRVRYVWQQNTGVAGARNRGLQDAQGELVAYLDSDNTWEQDFLTTMVGVLAADGVRLAYAASELLGGGVSRFRGQEYDAEVLRQSNHVDCIVMMHERSLVDEVGGFDSALRRFVDWELLLRMAAVSPPRYASFIATRYAVGDNAGEDRITRNESIGYRDVVIDRQLARWDHAPQVVTGRVSVVVALDGPADSVERAVELAGPYVGASEDFEVVLTTHGRVDAACGVPLQLLADRSDRIAVHRAVGTTSAVISRNIGVSRASGEVVILLDDAVNDQLPALLELAREALRTGGIVQAVVTDHAGVVVSCGVTVGPEGDVLRWGVGHLPDDELVMGEVDAVVGPVIAAPAAVLRSLRGASPLFMGGLWDVDLSLRATAAGAPVEVAGDVHVHLRPGASPARGAPTAADRREFARSWSGRGQTSRAFAAFADGGLQLVDDPGGGVPRRWDVVARPAAGTRRWVLRTCVPDVVIADSWGDWHFATALAAALRRAGEHVVVETVHARTRRAGHLDDVVLSLRGVHPLPATPGCRNLLWLLSHPDDVTRAELVAAEHVFVASVPFADILAERWGIDHVSPLLQCTDPERFQPVPAATRGGHVATGGIVFVGNTRGVLRPVVADALACGVPLVVHGQGWTGLVPDEVIGSTHIANARLGEVYGTAAVVLNDHWQDMRAHGFISNRVFDVVASGGVVVSDDVVGLGDLFGDRVVTYDGRDELPGAVERARAVDRRGTSVAERVRREHTFDARAAELMAKLDATSAV